MRFHLPAFLIADLKGEYRCDMAFPLAYLDDYRLTQFVALTSAQRAAVRTFLLHILEDPDYESDRPHIKRALEEYWTA